MFLDWGKTMTFYLGTTIISDLMMIAMIIHVIHYAGFTKTQKTWYVLTFCAIILCSSAEFLVHGIDYNPSLKVLLVIVTILQFSVAPLLAFLFSGALGLGNQAKIAIVFSIINFVVETVAAIFELVFYFDDGGYSRGKLFIIYEIFYFVSLVYLIVNMIRVGLRFHHRDTITIVMILVILVAGIIPMTIFQLHITYFAIALAASLCYIYYNDLVQQDIQSELVVNQHKVSNMQHHIISSLANLIENRDIETGEHVLRTSKFVEKLAYYAKVDGVYLDKIDDLFIAKVASLAPLHDIGKIVVSDRILRKPSKLTDEEYKIMKNHVLSGGTIVKEVLDDVTDADDVSCAFDIVRFHHEKWDGSGYPDHLYGENIPLAARLMAIADVYDALVSERCYKEKMSVDEAIEIIKSEAGRHFDPNLVEVFLRHKDDIIQ